MRFSNTHLGIDPVTVSVLVFNGGKWVWEKTTAHDAQQKQEKIDAQNYLRSRLTGADTPTLDTSMKALSIGAIGVVAIAFAVLSK